MTLFALTTLLLSLYFHTITAQWDALLVKIPSVTSNGQSGTCPSGNLDQVKNDIRSSLSQTVVPQLDLRETCPCGGAGPWRRIAYLDMSDPNQQCPGNWRPYVSTTLDACGAATGSSCSSAVFPSNGESYSRVCGRVIGYQKGSPDSFYPSVDGRNPGLNGVYVDGVSLTHGPAGSRQHIWTFAAPPRETSANINADAFFRCPCTNTGSAWPYQVPSYIENNYFCDTGNPGPDVFNQLYGDDPLWDGAGCGPNNSCCQFNTPPWFCTTLAQATTDDIELRICNDQGLNDEDVLVSLLDIHVM